ncbi:thioesterase [Polaribacter vadi]|uniref:Thioesterase n=1 Tax=Polaribacter vadi TaxID=1774273 RepID=A0A1B8TXT5_9FLAO|nr:PaaI family thioesterase [Polaribacter vadi]AOW16627.1 thioesterase [Polaribacter vadi]OBY64467.1 thioesterase [Polaribacter vadi]|tara:strand:- start:1084 stop:1500 length:417 start_codon:yes stop_codon:yes gene_type:complete
MDTKELLKAFNARNKNTLMETLDIEYVAIGDDFLTAKMPVSPKVHQPYGQLHGGATAALAETVGSAASNFFIDSKEHFINGIQLSINHIKSKREGVVFATAKNIHKGKTTHLWEVKIVDEEDNLISIAKMTNIILAKR